MRSVDVCIVGGGVVGLGIAYELAQTTNLSVAVLDKSGPGSGTSGRSAGVICRHDHGPIYQRLSLIGHARMKAFQAEHGLDFRTWGALRVIREPEAFPPHDPAAAELGAAPSGMYVNELLGREALLARFSWIAPEGALGGVFEPEIGFINPYELIDLYRALLAASGRVTLDYGNPVLGLKRRGSRISQLVTRRGLIRAGTVINASGAWANKVCSLVGTEVRITPQRMNVVVASPTEGEFPPMPLHGAKDVIWDGDGVWCRGESGGTALFGQHRDKTDSGRAVADPDFFDSCADAGFDNSVRRAIELYYRLPPNLVLNGWTCVYDLSDDGFPIVGRDPQVDNLIHAVGMNGHGMTIHAGVARCVGALLKTGARNIDISDVMPWPETLDFSVLRPERFAEGQPLVLHAHYQPKGHA
jgi:sarcosine oxidase subunit beta